MKNQSWNFQVEGMNYTLTTKGNQITIDPGETYKLKMLSKRGTFIEQSYEIPIPNATVALNIDLMGKTCLTVNGFDVNTREEHIPAKLPAWGWVFLVLYIVNFVLWLGGALGGAINFTLFSVTAKIASNTKQKAIVRVLICIAIFIAATIGEILIAGALYSVLPSRN